MRRILSVLAVLALSAAPALAQESQQPEENDNLILEDPRGADVIIQNPDSPEDILPSPPQDESQAPATETPEAVIPAPEEEQAPAEEETPEAVVPEGQTNLRSELMQNLAVEAGPGLSTFSGDLGDELDGGASFAGRFIIGSRMPVGAEIGYFGAVNTVDTVDNEVQLEIGDVDSNFTVYSNSIEALARVQAFGEKAVVRPFLAGGVNYYRLDSDLAAYDDSDTFGIPLAAGFQIFPMRYLTISTRAEYKWLLDAFGNDFPGGNQYGANLSVGAAF